MLYFSDQISDLHPELLGLVSVVEHLPTQARVKPGLGFIPSTTENHTEIQAHCTVMGKNTGSMPAETWPPNGEGRTGTRDFMGTE